MTLHLVHADEKGNVAVVAVLLEKGEDNALVHTIWEDLPKEKEKVESEKDVRIDARPTQPLYGRVVLESP
jgi:carbonic anhydrase